MQNLQEHLYNVEMTTRKEPVRLHLQVYDHDIIPLLDKKLGKTTPSVPSL